MEAACANRLDGPTTKLSKVYLEFKIFSCWIDGADENEGGGDGWVGLAGTL
jgi:hypothetical protein